MDGLNTKVGFKCWQGFIFDLCHGLRYIGRQIFEQELVEWAYGCPLQPLNIFCEGMEKELFCNIMEPIHYVSKKIDLICILRKLEALQSSVFKKVWHNFEMVLQHKSSWSAINFMYIRLLTVFSGLYGPALI